MLNKDEAHQINIFLFDDFYSLDEDYFKKKIKKIQKKYKIYIFPDSLNRGINRSQELTPTDIILRYKKKYDNNKYKGHTFFITNGKIEGNYYGKPLGECWRKSYGYLKSFYQLDKFINDWRLLDENISRFLIIQIFKLTTRINIYNILLNEDSEEIELFHREDKGRCIFNFGREKFIVAFEINNPIICDKCMDKINSLKKRTDLSSGAKSQIFQEFNFLKNLLKKIKYPNSWQYLKNTLFKNPIVNFVYSGLLFGILINIIYHFISIQSQDVITNLLIFSLSVIILIPIILVLVYFINIRRKN